MCIQVNLLRGELVVPVIQSALEPKLLSDRFVLLVALHLQVNGQTGTIPQCFRRLKPARCYPKWPSVSEAPVWFQTGADLKKIKLQKIYIKTLRFVIDIIEAYGFIRFQFLGHIIKLQNICWEITLCSIVFTLDDILAMMRQNVGSLCRVLVKSTDAL